MRNLKNNKVAGIDGIHMELIKYGGNTRNLLNGIFEPVRQILEEERISDEWKATIGVPIYKKEKETGVRITGEQHQEMQLTKFWCI